MVPGNTLGFGEFYHKTREGALPGANKSDVQALPCGRATEHPEGVRCPRLSKR